MARGDKNYSEVTHKASKKGTKERIKAVHDMVGYKKKLQEMVEALINGDSKAAAASLHDYLQIKTRAVLGETDHEDMGDDEMVADRHEDDGEGEFGHEHEDGEECPECGMEPCECEHDDEGEGDEDFDADEEFGGEGEGEHGEGEFEMHEGVRNFPKGGSKGTANSSSGERKTSMKKLSGDAKHLERKVKGTNNFEKTSSSGTKKSTSGMHTTSMKKNSMGAKDLESKVKGKLNFEKTSGNGTKSDSSGARKTAMKKLSGDAKDLERKVKGKNEF